MSKRKHVVVVFAVVAIAVAVPTFAGGGPDAAAIYKAKCAMCHAADGSGNTPTGKAMKVRDLGSAEVQKMSNAELNKVIADGKGKMPAYKSKLDQASIDALIEFIRTLKK
jgi:mono/diheme cytochrome c family protein